MISASEKVETEPRKDGFGITKIERKFLGAASILEFAYFTLKNRHHGEANTNKHGNVIAF